MTFAEKLKYTRKLARLTQTELAGRMGCTTQMVCQYESGARMPKWETMKRFAEALDVPLANLYGDEQAPLINSKDALERQDGDALSHSLGLPSGSVRFVGKVESAREAELLIAFRELTIQQQEAVMMIVRGMK